MLGEKGVHFLVVTSAVPFACLCPRTLCRCCWYHRVTPLLLPRPRPGPIRSAATASFELEKYADAIDWADRGLRIELSNKELIELRQKAVKAKAAKEKRDRMAAARERKEAKERQLLEAGIKVRSDVQDVTLVWKMPRCDKPTDGLLGAVGQQRGGRYFGFTPNMFISLRKPGSRHSDGAA